MSRKEDRSTYFVSSSFGLTTMVVQRGSCNLASGKGRRGGGPSEDEAAAPIRGRRSSAQKTIPALVAAAATGVVVSWLCLPASSGRASIAKVPSLLAAN